MISHGSCSEAEKETQSLLCSLCRKTQSSTKRCALGKAIWINIPYKMIPRQSLLEHESRSCHESAVSREATRALSGKDDEISRA